MADREVNLIERDAVGFLEVDQLCQVDMTARSTRAREFINCAGIRAVFIPVRQGECFPQGIWYILI